LSSLGFIDTEFIDEVAGVRNTYHKAFEQLFYTAAQTVLNGTQPNNQPKLLTFDEQQNIIKEKLSSLSDQELSPLKYTLSIQNSRYDNDFVQCNMLGKGGFASAWRARNKLDDIEYAIKKIKLKQQDGYYDKIFREIKNLARLEHNNVVRYYSSWLEYDASSKGGDIEDDDDDDDGEYEEEEEEEEEEEDPTFQPESSNSESDSNSEEEEEEEEDSFINFAASAGGAENSHSSNSTINKSLSNSNSRNPCANKQDLLIEEQEEQGGFILFIQMQLCPSKSRITIK
jgi:translation initiation factor 2-alpha kinase 1